RKPPARDPPRATPSRSSFPRTPAHVPRTPARGPRTADHARPRTRPSSSNLSAALHISGHSSLTRTKPRKDANHRDHLRDGRLTVGRGTPDNGYFGPR